ncbi:unnamed protein product [Allacma fusca]|uniref:Uncharacterized protein n=1 Tax=Allacma fusca TaxID=39272 RepID=A0A8J2PK99_9HEXA|nr:unnamed protein product [Allacma fusca]
MLKKSNSAKRKILKPGKGKEMSAKGARLKHQQELEAQERLINNILNNASSPLNSMVSRCIDQVSSSSPSLDRDPPDVSSLMLPSLMNNNQEGKTELSMATTNLHRTSSPSAGIRSEMEYVVQKIAALARATSVDSTDSNANIKFGSTD